MKDILSLCKNGLWGPPLLILLLGTGVFYTFFLRGVQFRYMGFALKEAFFPAKKKEGEGDITSFQALMTSLAGAVGTGTIVGVTTSVTLGGFGSLFWMWVTAFFGMATKYAESLLAVKYRDVDPNGEMIGGPMEYMAKGLGWKMAASLFAGFGVLAACTTGNMVQANAIAESFQQLANVDTTFLGICLAFILGIVIFGGVKSIGKVAGALVPVMAFLYFAGACVLLSLHVEKLPSAFAMIFEQAFSFQAAAGGTLGGGLLLALQMGVSRSVFSNEAGLGISSIAAAAAKTDSPGRQGMITMTGALLSTLVLCTLTGLALAVTGVVGMQSEGGEVLSGATVAIVAFESVMPNFGSVVSVGLILFAFSTLMAWAYYGEKCFEYLFGVRWIHGFRAFFVFLVIPASVLHVDVVWLLADVCNGLMVIPNLLALLGLRNVVRGETDRFIASIEQERGLAGELT